MSKENVIFVDFIPNENWGFMEKLSALPLEKWNVLFCKTNTLHGGKLASVQRMFWYFFFPLQMVFKRKKYDKIIGWQQFYGLNFAFWCRLFHLKKVNDLTVMTLIYKRKSGGIGYLYHQYMKYIVTSKYINRFICFAKEECEYYSEMFGVDKSKFVFVPLGKAMASNTAVTDGKYIFATGRSNRDYDFLVEAVKDSEYKLVIACDTYHLREKVENVTVLNDCHGEQMLELMAKSHCVVCPLKNLKLSSGQLVVLQAMSLGKPVVCTMSDGIKDYVVGGVTGLLVKNEKEEWLEALDRMYSNPEDYNEMSRMAKKTFFANFTENAMYERISKIVNQ